jgi:hypothetical protein
MLCYAQILALEVKKEATDEMNKNCTKMSSLKVERN